MPDSARERYRRAALRLPQRGGGERTGHAAMFAAGEVVSFEPFTDHGQMRLRDRRPPIKPVGSEPDALCCSVPAST